MPKSSSIESSSAAAAATSALRISGVRDARSVNTFAKGTYKNTNCDAYIFSVLQCTHLLIVSARFRQFVLSRHCDSARASRCCCC
jgi:hypothetical protein